MELFSIFVEGVPQPKGSTRAFAVKSKKTGKYAAVVTSANAKLKPWEKQIAEEAMVALLGAPGLLGPICLRLTFWCARPASVRPSQRPHMTVKPDIDKLARGVLDALTGILYKDDAQVVRLDVSKGYTDGRPGVEIAARLDLTTWCEAPLVGTGRGAR